MHNLAKLSPMSQTFIGRLQPGSATNIAAARAVANKLPLPSFEVKSIDEQYHASVYETARSLISDLNEVATINARDVLAMVEMFWKVRYYTLFPPKNIMPMANGCISNFMGFGAHIPQGMLEDIKCGGEGIVRSLNGFCNVLCDLTDAKIDKPDENSMASAVPVASA